MDAHFDDYMAAVIGLQEIYGERGDDHRVEFHDDTASLSDGVAAVSTPLGS